MTKRNWLTPACRAGSTVGDTVRLVAGCDKTTETCHARFDNILNFRGEPHIPGNDKVFSYPVR